MNSRSLKKDVEPAHVKMEELGHQIRAACERVDSLQQRARESSEGQELLSEAFEILFTLLEQLRLRERELRMKSEELISAHDILEVERRRYRELFESAPDAYILTDSKGTVELANLSAAILFKIGQHHILGMPLILFVAKKDQQLCRSLLQTKGEQVVKGLELKLQPKQGQLVPAVVTVGIIEGPTGEPAGLHWFIRDLTEKTRMEEALKTSEDRFRSVTQTAKDAIIVADDRGKISTWNLGAEQMFGYLEKDAVGQPLSMLMPERFQDVHQARLEKYRKDSSHETGAPMELYGIKKNGQEFPIEISISSWHTNGKTFFSEIIRDITERKQAEETRIRLIERLILAQEQERRWIARELHDEAGPSLTSLLLGLRLIEDSKTLQKAKVEAGRLRKITSQTLDDLGRLARGLHPTILDDLGLAVALHRYASDFSQNFGIHVEFEISGFDGGRLPLVVETALFRIAQEAMNNTAKHANAKNIAIRLDRGPTSVQLVLQDDGRGFDLDAALRNAATSNRLGLYGMRERAALLGGTVSIDSSAGNGTIVRLDLPNFKEEKSANQISMSVSPGS